MAKVADKYLQVDPWAVVEEKFDAARNRVSESIFSLGNEYMGVRGYPEEGYSGDSLLGSYFNGLYEEMKVNAHYKGTISKLRFMVNAVDWLYTRISADGEMLDLAQSQISNFTRRLDFKTGEYERRFDWHLSGGGTISIRFRRLVSMTNSHLGIQRIEFQSNDYDGEISVRTGLDFSPVHEDQGRNLWQVMHRGRQGDWMGMVGQTVTTGNRLFTTFVIRSDETLHTIPFEEEKLAGVDFALRLGAGGSAGFTKLVINYADKGNKVDEVETLWDTGYKVASLYEGTTYDDILTEQTAYWTRIWEQSDIEIQGDPENQQGIRYCIFQLYQTYRGDNPGFNIGAKGLTGEAYRGLAFWDTETYCLPFYLFNNPKAARSLLEFRYKSLSHALERAREVDCQGAFYPIATIDGTESCDLWQHANLQLQVGTAVGYAIWHYDKLVGDKPFLYGEGIEMLLQLSRFYESRGQWGPRTGKFGYYGVMGPDEFQLMVNNNCYLNIMAKKLFEYTLAVLEEMEREAPMKLHTLTERLGVTEDEYRTWAHLAENMYIPYDTASQVFEQHDGFFDMPNIDVDTIPVEDFPLYHNWSYDRIYRYDMVKQPDVLMFMFLYTTEYTHAQKQANYDYYEPRCIHESSLSPSIHSIFASELGRHDEAYRFFEFATRLDLDNYNRNTREGLHTTSIAAAWMNIVYGFGGMRSDGEQLQFEPSIPVRWDGYSFQITYRGTVVHVRVTREEVTVRSLSGEPVELLLYGRACRIDADGVVAPIPADRVG
ncbi:maltose phosphorylase [Paenibacillus albidus]|uniref:Maltose phosphorylase n=1 Tax=Paenibacillus albidus TaxID=2041023 RepID=A0A917CW12_9BACL|nr:glycosyl hydrolase family 65 protein [Paenibacillus albidus]GGF99698.1 maltose phosphorylase [Paenibacillus albidus]